MAYMEPGQELDSLVAQARGEGDQLEYSRDWRAAGALLSEMETASGSWPDKWRVGADKNGVYYAVNRAGHWVYGAVSGPHAVALAYLAWKQGAAQQ